MQTPLRLAGLTCLLLSACAGWESYEGESRVGLEPGQPARPLFVSLTQARALMEGGAVVLDAREGALFQEGHLPGAQSAPWHAFVDGERTGSLSTDVERLGKQLRALGVSRARTVLVYGSWDQAWGEEGRILWMLEYLGHDQVRILLGGYQGWVGADGAIHKGAAAAAKGDFVPSPRPELRATAADVQEAVEDARVVILDARTTVEYMGATPHGSPRGGHIPGAVHLHWQDLLEGGELKSPARVRKLLAGLGITQDTLVLAYCTGGIRSGFVYAVMRWAGYDRTRNYDGSYWEWSTDPERPVER